MISRLRAIARGVELAQASVDEHQAGHGLFLFRLCFFEQALVAAGYDFSRMLAKSSTPSTVLMMNLR